MPTKAQPQGFITYCWAGTSRTGHWTVPQPPRCCWQAIQQADLVESSGRPALVQPAAAPQPQEPPTRSRKRRHD